MGYKYLDHEADVGLLSWGAGVEQAFVDGAKGMFGMMVNINQIEPKKRIKIECTGSDIAGLFVEWLNEILTQKDLEDMFFSDFEVEYIKQKSGKYYLKGYAIGNKIDLENQEVKTEVKGATFSGLKYEKKQGKHYLQCVLDI